MPIQDLLLLPLTGPFKGLLFIARQIAQEAENVLYDEETIRGTLLDLELRLQDGKISQEEYIILEEKLIERLNIALQRRLDSAQSEKKQKNLKRHNGSKI